METEAPISDEAIITLLQGPLRIPRSSSGTSSGAKSPARDKCSSSLLLLCFYFLFHQDPYGRKISSATLHSQYLRHSVPFYEFIARYWDGEHWKRMLQECKGLDFVALAQRQQKKFTGFTWTRSLDRGGGKWVRRRVATCNFCGDEEWTVRIGPLDEFQVVFEFEDEECADGSRIEDEGWTSGIDGKSHEAAFLTEVEKTRRSFLQLLCRGFMMENAWLAARLRELLVVFLFLACFHFVCYR